MSSKAQIVAHHGDVPWKGNMLVLAFVRTPGDPLCRVMTQNIVAFGAPTRTKTSAVLLKHPPLPCLLASLLFPRPSSRGYPLSKSIFFDVHCHSKLMHTERSPDFLFGVLWNCSWCEVVSPNETI